MRRLPILLLLLAACETPASDRSAAAPVYGARTLAGDSLNLAELRGEAVLLNVWATWCPPCREEMPGLQALHEARAGRGLRVLGVSIDRAGQRAAVEAFVAEYGLDFTILLDPQERVTRRFRTLGVPETVLIDREGRLARRWIGRIDAMAPDFVATVDSVLGAGGAPQGLPADLPARSGAGL